MSRGRLAVVLVGAAALSFFGSCSLKGPTSPSGGGGSATFADEGAHFAGGVHPAPLVINGVTYVYVNSATDGTTVEASSDGRTFAPTAARYPAGASRTIVSLPDGRFRMYYFPDGTSVDVRSAVSRALPRRAE